MRVAIHQPEYFPWLGFVAKARRADVLVLLDHVQFDRSSLQHRAKVAGPNGLVWLTIPFVHRFPQRIDEVELADDRWRTKHWKTLTACYGRAPGWPTAAHALEGFFGTARARLVDATIGSVELTLAAFGVTTRRLRSSTLGVPGDRAELVLAICRALGATTYLSGKTGATYLDGAAFAAAGITVEVMAGTPPDYPRARPLPDDVRGLSALDAWCQLGEGARSLMETS
jgi:WbqC-like protein family